MVAGGASIYLTPRRILMSDRAIPESPLERVDAIPPREFLERYRRHDRPVVIRGAVDSWPAMSRWSIEYLRDKVGDVEVDVMAYEEGGRNERVYVRMPLAEYLDKIKDPWSSSTRYYLSQA